MAPRPHLFIVCDFDGTVTTEDTLDLLVGHFAPGAWERAEAGLRSGRMSLLQAMEEEFREVRAGEDEVLAFIRHHAVVRPGFAEFVRWAEDEGHRLVIVSAGFRVVIDAVLADAGLGHLHVHAGDAHFSRTGTQVSYPPSSAPCADRCGICKTETIEAHGPFEGPVVYVGDGYSDRCAAREADLVFARQGLAEYLAAEGVPFLPYEDFYDVLAALQRRALEPLPPSLPGG